MLRLKWKTFGMIMMICMMIMGSFPVQIYAQGAAPATTTAAPKTTTAVTSASAGSINPALLPQVDIVKTEIVIKKKKKKQLEFNVKNTTKDNIVWTSSNNKIATVNNKGVVKAKGGGDCIITATVKGTDICDTILVTSKNYYTMRVKTTGYCNCRRCAGPWAGCRTASGKRPRANHTIAVDRRVIRLGTKVKIGKITYVAEDTGSGVRGRMIDIYYKSHRKASRHGVKWRTAKIYY